MQIHYAAARGDISAVQRQLTRGLSVNERTPKRYEQDPDYGYTPLMFAARDERAGVDMLRFLVKAGADVNAVSEGSLENTPLSLAAHDGHFEKTQYLLEAGSNPLFRNKGGYTALIYAAYGGADMGVKIVKLLLDAGADPNAPSTYCESPLSVASLSMHFNVVKTLLDAGAKPETLEWTPLMHAVVFGSLEDVQQELRGKPDLEARDRWKSTPWRLSLVVGDIEKAKLLQQYTDQVDSSDLVWVVRKDNVEMVKWLISLGADPYAPAEDAFGSTALMEAARYGSTECVKLLLAAGADVLALDRFSSQAISGAGNAEIVKLLIDAGADIHYEDGEGYTKLKHEAENGEEDMVRALLELGALPDASRWNDTPLRVAVRDDKIEVVKLLLAAGANPNIRTLDEWCPLDDVKSVEMLQILLNAGADPTIENFLRKKQSEYHTDPEIVALLKQAETALSKSETKSGNGKNENNS